MLLASPAHNVGFVHPIQLLAEAAVKQAMA